MNNQNVDITHDFYNITLMGLSPLYIGAGDKYSQLDYIVKDNKIYILDFDELLSQIPMEVINDLTNEITQNFQNNIWAGDVEEFLGKYEINWQKCIEKTYDLVGVIGKNEINQFIKTGNIIYIPGSSVKGAIRTAIFFDIIDNHPNKRKELEKTLLRYFNDRDIKKLLQSERKSDAKRDLLRALIISDFELEKKNVLITKSYVYHLREKEKTIPIYNEVLTRNFTSSGSIKINKKLINTKNALFTDYFDLKKENIINAINNLSNTIIEHELKEFNALGDPELNDIIQFYENLTNQMKSLEENECILRLGQGSSVLQITLFLNFKHNKQIVAKYKNLELVNFNAPDNRDRGKVISRKEGKTYIIDKKAKLTGEKPKLKETWLCEVPKKSKGKTIFVKPLNRVTDSFNFEGLNLLYPLTRKFMVSKENKLKLPFGWVKLTWK